MIWVFWISFALLVWAYVGYAVVWSVLAAIFPKRGTRSEPPDIRATLLVAAHNEAGSIAAKIENALQIDVSPATLDIVVTCDGCTDGTAQIARGYEDQGVKVLDCPDHLGKASALNAALADITSDVVVFSDANSIIRPEALTLLLRHFHDETVGGACGAIGVKAGEGSWLEHAEAVYWAYDHILKKAESRIAGAVSAQGSLYAVRRNLIGTVPEALADDSAVSLDVVRQGFRLVFEPGATVAETVTSSPPKEFGRRVRSTERGWRSLMHFSELLNPFRHGLYSVQLISHKLLRRLTPFLVLFLMISGFGLADQGLAYPLLSSLLLAFATIGALGFAFRDRLPKLFAAPVFFVVMSVAMMLGVLNAMMGRRTVTWSPARSG